jgi:hypothetical protein
MPSKEPHSEQLQMSMNTGGPRSTVRLAPGSEPPGLMLAATSSSDRADQREAGEHHRVA